MQVTVVFTYLRHTVEKHGNLQQSVREKVYNSQLTQVNPTIPRRFGNEIRTSVSTSGPQELKGYVNGKPYYGPFHPHDIKDEDGKVIRTIKMVGAEHSSYPHEIIYDTMAESLPASASYTVITDGAPSGDDDQQQEQQQQQEDNQQQQQQEDNQQQQEDNQQQQQQQEDNQQQQQQQDNNNNQQQQNQGGGGYGGGY